MAGLDLTTGDIRRLNNISFEIIDPKTPGVTNELTWEHFIDRLKYRTATKGDKFILSGYKFKVINKD